jgi:arylsulfatase A-like enzyme
MRDPGEAVKRPKRSAKQWRLVPPLFALLAAWIANGAGCGAPPPPNVLLVSVDTLRADALGAYGGPVATPAFDGLARDGVLFEQAIAPAPQTTPSHATLFTGQEVLHHGALRNGAPLDAAAETLAEVLRHAGYATAGFASSFVLDDRFGWAQGFDVYESEFPRRGETMRHRGALWKKFEFEGFDRRAGETNAHALPWLAAAPEPFFLFVHYFDPHAPYAGRPRLVAQVPDAFARREAADRIDGLRAVMPGIDREQLAHVLRHYQAEVLAVDAALGALLAALDARGLRDRTLVVVAADHGEGLGQHGTLDHAPNVYEEQVRVPLLLRWPGSLAAGRRIAEPVGLVDVAPTIAELAGAQFTGELDGRSLAGALQAGAVRDPRPIIGRRQRYERVYQGHRGTKFFVRSDRWKYIRATEDPDELYDLEADPNELRDLHAANPEAAARLGGILDAALARHPDRVISVEPSEEVRRGLEALGYAE